jgi:hypothetical protein
LATRLCWLRLNAGGVAVLRLHRVQFSTPARHAPGVMLLPYQTQQLALAAAGAALTIMEMHAAAVVHCPEDAVVMLRHAPLRLDLTLRLRRYRSERGRGSSAEDMQRNVRFVTLTVRSLAVALAARPERADAVVLLRVVADGDVLAAVRSSVHGQDAEAELRACLPPARLHIQAGGS